MARHDGEASDAFDARAVGALTRIAGAHEGSQVLVVTHGGVVRALDRHLSESRRACSPTARRSSFRYEGAVFARID